jgi:phosphatidyl-myo-inositol dimannoside synthase
MRVERRLLRAVVYVPAMREITARLDGSGARRARSTSKRSAGERPRLLLVTPDFPPARGGIQALSHGVATGITGFETRVVTLGGQDERDFDAAGELAVSRVKVAAGLGRGRIAALNAGALVEALRFRPDMTLSAHIVASPAAVAIRRALGARTAQYLHANEIADKPRLAAFAAQRADAVIALSSYTAELIRATGASVNDIRLIPPGVELPGDPTPKPAERPTIVTIARMNDSYKGHDVLMRALALIREHVPSVQWMVIGEGPLRSGLEELAGMLGVADSVRFLGSVSDEQRDDWLRSADVFAMPSRLPDGGLAGEGFGIVFLEAASYGKPVVAGNVGGALDAVLDEETGLLVDPTDADALAGAISRLLLDRELAQRLGARGAEWAKAFAWPLIASRVEAVLLEQLEQARV